MPLKLNDLSLEQVEKIVIGIWYETGVRRAEPLYSQ